MSGFNAPFAAPEVKQQLRMLFPPRLRKELDKLIAQAERPRSGLARLNPQPPKSKPPQMTINLNPPPFDAGALTPIIEAIEARGFTVVTLPEPTPEVAAVIEHAVEEQGFPLPEGPIEVQEQEVA